MQASGQLQASAALSMGKVSGTHWMGKGKGPKNTLGKKRKEKFHTTTEIRTTISRLPERGLVPSTDCTIPTLLFCSLINIISCQYNYVFCNSLKRHGDVYSGKQMSTFQWNLLSDSIQCFLWNAGAYLPDHTASHSRGLSSSYPPPRKPNVSYIFRQRCSRLYSHFPTDRSNKAVSLVDLACVLLLFLWQLITNRNQ